MDLLATDLEYSQLGVNTLMGLWRFVIAARIETDEDAAQEAQAILDEITPDACFDRATWPSLTMLVEIEPDGDVLPVRARYARGGTWQIGVNPLTSTQPLWYALPDLVAAKLLSSTGKTPRVTRAVKLTPRRTQRGLKKVELGGRIACDPREDFFRRVIEERKSLEDGPLPPAEQARMDRFLKVLANSTSYGIYAEMIRQEQPANETVKVDVHRLDGESTFAAPVSAPEDLGVHFFGPLAALITSAARLMLALAEHEVTRRGGTYAFCDADSLAIVANEHGGPVTCPGGPTSDDQGESAIRALSWRDVEEIRERFATLNPYDPDKVRGSVLELEDENFTDHNKQIRRQLYCYSISAKRYALYTLDETGKPMLEKADEKTKRGRLIRRGEKWSEHGLGHLLDPTDRTGDESAWPCSVWHSIVTEALTGERPTVEFESRPAIGRSTAGKPRLLKAFESLDNGQPYDLQIKPFNFLLSAHVAPETGDEKMLARVRGLASVDDSSIVGTNTHDRPNLFNADVEGSRKVKGPLVGRRCVGWLDQRRRCRSPPMTDQKPEGKGKEAHEVRRYIGCRRLSQGDCAIVRTQPAEESG